VPRERAAEIVEPHVTLNYTTVLNIVFLALAAILLVRFFPTNGLAMLRMMNRPPAGASTQDTASMATVCNANEGSSMAADPICEMQVKTDRATATAEFVGKTYYFSSTACWDRFQKNPERDTRQTA
jgi:YHS domain-containing protein